MIINGAKLWLDSGVIFGDDGEGYQRINIACPRVTLQQALTQLKEALENLNQKISNINNIFFQKDVDKIKRYKYNPYKTYRKDRK